MFQLAALVVEPGVPEIKCLLLARKRPLEIRFSLEAYTPRVGIFIEGDGTNCFASFVVKFIFFMDIQTSLKAQLRWAV